ncbi:hypothetical protein BJF79_36025 [Actinomadura sp. CNU-125]|nr:hypothetical protein [Actinomadura sp. CNU-125]OLT32473.1 hypothetical protein BJF79_36025 [Actinomadura sp. CNU-125]
MLATSRSRCRGIAANSSSRQTRNRSAGLASPAARTAASIVSPHSSLAWSTATAIRLSFEPKWYPIEARCAPDAAAMSRAVVRL